MVEMIDMGVCVRTVWLDSDTQIEQTLAYDKQLDRIRPTSESSVAVA